MRAATHAYRRIVAKKCGNPEVAPLGTAIMIGHYHGMAWWVA